MNPRVSLILLVAFSLSSAVNGRCPNLLQVDPLFDSEHFLCSIIWQEIGNDSQELACNIDGPCLNTSAPLSIPDESSVSYNNPDFEFIGSLGVMPGCTFREFSQSGQGGFSVAYPAGLYPKYPGFVGEPTKPECPSGAQSYSCECLQKPIQCDPFDFLEVVGQCDNSAGDTELNCYWAADVGTAYTEEVESWRAISTPVSKALEEGMDEIYAFGIGVSDVTEYNWSNAPLGLYSDYTVDGFAVNETLVAGVRSINEQVVGNCGGHVTRANYFKETLFLPPPMKTQGGNGKLLGENRVTVERFYRMERDGTKKYMEDV